MQPDQPAELASAEGVPELNLKASAPPSDHIASSTASSDAEDVEAGARDDDEDDEYMGDEEEDESSSSISASSDDSLYEPKRTRGGGARAGRSRRAASRASDAAGSQQAAANPTTPASTRSTPARAATQQASKPGSSQRFTGVYNQGCGRWRAQFCHGGIVHQLGMYDSEEGAAQAWDRVAWVYRGTAAQLNFPDLVAEYDQESSRQAVHELMDDRMGMYKARGKAAAAANAGTSSAKGSGGGSGGRGGRGTKPTGRAGAVRKVPNKYIPGAVVKEGGAAAAGTPDSPGQESGAAAAGADGSTVTGNTAHEPSPPLAAAALPPSPATAALGAPPAGAATVKAGTCAPCEGSRAEAEQHMGAREGEQDTGMAGPHSTQRPQRKRKARTVFDPSAFSGTRRVARGGTSAEMKAEHAGQPPEALHLTVPSLNTTDLVMPPAGASGLPITMHDVAILVLPDQQLHTSTNTSPPPGLAPPVGHVTAADPTADPAGTPMMNLHTTTSTKAPTSPGLAPAAAAAAAAAVMPPALTAPPAPPQATPGRGAAPADAVMHVSGTGDDGVATARDVAGPFTTAPSHLPDAAHQQPTGPLVVLSKEPVVMPMDDAPRDGSLESADTYLAWKPAEAFLTTTAPPGCTQSPVQLTTQARHHQAVLSGPLPQYSIAPSPFSICPAPVLPAGKSSPTPGAGGKSARFKQFKGTAGNGSGGSGGSGASGGRNASSAACPRSTRNPSKVAVPVTPSAHQTTPGIVRTGSEAAAADLLGSFLAVAHREASLGQGGVEAGKQAPRGGKCGAGGVQSGRVAKTTAATNGTAIDLLQGFGSGVAAASSVTPGGAGTRGKGGRGGGAGGRGQQAGRGGRAGSTGQQAGRGGKQTAQPPPQPAALPNPLAAGGVGGNIDLFNLICLTLYGNSQLAAAAPPALDNNTGAGAAPQPISAAPRVVNQSAVNSLAAPVALGPVANTSASGLLTTSFPQGGGHSVVAAVDQMRTITTTNTNRSLPTQPLPAMWSPGAPLTTAATTTTTTTMPQVPPQPAAAATSALNVSPAAAYLPATPQVVQMQGLMSQTGPPSSAAQLSGGMNGSGGGVGDAAQDGAYAMDCLMQFMACSPVPAQPLHAWSADFAPVGFQAAGAGAQGMQVVGSHVMQSVPGPQGTAVTAAAAAAAAAAVVAAAGGAQPQPASWI